MLYSIEQMKAYAHARELIPEIPTLADLHALTESHAELVARVAELEAKPPESPAEENARLKRQNRELRERVRELDPDRGCDFRLMGREEVCCQCGRNRREMFPEISRCEYERPLDD